MSTFTKTKKKTRKVRSETNILTIPVRNSLISAKTGYRICFTLKLSPKARIDVLCGLVVHYTCLHLTFHDVSLTEIFDFYTQYKATNQTNLITYIRLLFKVLSLPGKGTIYLTEEDVVEL